MAHLVVSGSCSVRLLLRAGVYFDIKVANTSSVYLALNNAISSHAETAGISQVKTEHFVVRMDEANQRPADPISLLVQIDNDEFIVLSEVSDIVCVCANTLNAQEQHSIRIIVPGRPTPIMEFEGLWLDPHGTLLPVSGASTRPVDRKKIVEIVTDASGLLGQSPLAGVTGWDSLIGDMFSADHSIVSVDSACLTRDCIAGAGYPAGMGDTFFRRYSIAGQRIVLIKVDLQVRIISMCHGRSAAIFQTLW